MIQVISCEESERWNNIVTNFNNYEPYYLLDYCLAYYLEGHGKPNLLYYSDEFIDILHVYLLRDIADDKSLCHHIPNGKYFDIVTPYGYGGPIFQYKTNDKSLLQKSVANFFEHYNKYCQEQNIVSEFIRFNPLHEIPPYIQEFYQVEYNRDTISMDLTDKDQIWTNMKTRARTAIRKCLNNNMEVVIDNTQDNLMNFIEMYYKTMDKNQATDTYYFSQEHFENLMLNKSNHIFNVIFNGEYISSSLILKGDNNIHYHLSATEPEYYSYSPNNLLLYEVANWGATNGYQEFHLGGGTSSEKDGLFRFKESMNKKGRKSFYVGKKIFDENCYNKLVSIKGVIEIRDKYFPLYRYN